MNVRLIVSRNDVPQATVYKLLCMDCEHDVFYYVDSAQFWQPDLKEPPTLECYECEQCHRRVWLESETHLMEEVTDDWSWSAIIDRLCPPTEKNNGSLNESVSDPSAFRE